MTPIPQQNRPMSLIVLDTGFSLLGAFSVPSIPWFALFYPRPEDIQYTYPSRGTVVQTFDGGFVDDFGAGVADITVSGHTGWRGVLLPGEVEFYNLRDMIMSRFHLLRKAKADAGQPIDTVKMYWVDTLSLQMYEVYPISFVGRKNKQRPLLYQYQIRLAGLELVAGPSMLPAKIAGLLA